MPGCYMRDDPLREENDMTETTPKFDIEKLNLHYGAFHALKDINMQIDEHKITAFIGPSGCGKSTFLKTAAGLIPPVKGTLTLGQQVLMGYFDQQTAALQSDLTVVEHFHEQFPSLTDKEVRQTLGAFLFTGKDTAKKVSSLSGGEKSRLVLAELFKSCPNFFVLDEPTNHMDIPAKETLESAFRAYTGTLLFVSHDRYFINQTCSRILELVNQTFVNYIGNYDYYLEKKEELTRAYASATAVSAGIAPSESSSDNQTESKLSWQEQKEQQAKERKRKNDLKKTEEEIAKLEERNTVIDEELTKEEIYSNSIECQKLSTERAENEEKLEVLYERWEELAEEV